MTPEPPAPNVSFVKELLDKYNDQILEIVKKKLDELQRAHAAQVAVWLHDLTEATQSHPGVNWRMVNSTLDKMTLFLEAVET